MSAGAAAPAAAPFGPREIGATGVRVHPVGWGVMPLSTRSTRPDRTQALAVFRAALDAGVTFWDTADSYCLNDRETGHNERLIAWAIAELGVAGRVHVASKGGMTRPGGAWERDGRPAHLRRACEQSLRNLGVEQIFLYQFHWPDPKVPYAESMGALAELQREGKLRHVGISNVTPELLRQAQGICRVESVQNRCSPTDAGDLRNGLVALCAEQRVTYIPYSPLGGGSGHRGLARQRVLAELGARHGCSAYRVALGWLLAKGPHVLPIPGASQAAHLADSAAAAGLRLAPEELRRVDALGR
jgi:aryl-alcohol dehydrogenase-like predicted oxidoreductase